MISARFSRRAALAPFAASIGKPVIFVHPTGDAERGSVEHGVIAYVDDRMVYVDYGYPNAVWPELGNVIATHPANLRLEPAPDESETCARCAAPEFSAVVPIAESPQV